MRSNGVELGGGTHTRVLRRRFIGAVLSVIVLSILGQVLNQRALAHAADDAHVLNVWGRQRMLSQRICKAALLLASQSPSGDPARAELRHSLADWEQAHRDLRRSLDSPSLSPGAVAALSRRLVSLDAPFGVMHAAATAIVGNTSGVSEVAVSELLGAEPHFLKAMEGVVARYESDASERVQRIARGELALVALTVVVLVVQGIFVFAPALDRAEANVEALRTSRAEMQALLVAIPEPVLLIDWAGQVVEVDAFHPESVQPPEASSANTTNEAPNADSTLPLSVHVDEHVLSVVRRVLVDAGSHTIEGAPAVGADRRVEFVVSRFDEDRAIVLARDVSRQRAAELRALDTQAATEQTLGAELHDGPCQRLTGAVLLAQAMERSAERGVVTRPDLVRELVSELRGSLEELRNLSRSLYPAALQANGLVDALRRLCESFNASAAVHCTFEDATGGRVVSDRTAIHLYRIAQESLANALRHAEAEHVQVRLAIDETSILLQVEDDGRGVAGDRSGAGIGLFSMAARASALGARLAIDSVPGEGTRVSCRLLSVGNVDLTRADPSDSVSRRRERT